MALIVRKTPTSIRPPGTDPTSVSRSVMVYSLKQTSSVEEQFRLIADYQIGEALSTLESYEKDRTAIVHDIRKRCKKLRGLIQLFRLSFAGYKEENKTFKEIACLFDDLRDAKVTHDTYASLMDNLADPIDRSFCSNMRLELESRRNNLSTNTAWESRKRQAKSLLLAARWRAEEWSLSEGGWAALHGGLAKTYSRARKAMRKARKEPNGPNHHEWRKQVKYHWCHTRLLKRTFPKVLKLRASLLQDLTNKLGDHHDLYVFGETLDREPQVFGNEENLAVLRTLAERKSTSFEDASARSGVRLFADDVDALSSRWAAWWCAWQAEEVQDHAT